MLGGLQRQLDPGHGGHLAAPEAGCIDHPPRPDVTVGRAHDPAAVGLLLGAGDRREAVDFRAALACSRGIGMGHARRVDIAARGFEHDAADAVEIHQRVQAFGLVTAHLVEVQPVIFRLGSLQPQLVFARLGLRQIQRARLVHAAALTGLCLQRFVQVHGVVLDAGDVVVVVQAMDAGRRMPGRAGRQFVALQQNNIGPAELCQMIQDGAADEAAANYHGLGMGAHEKVPFTEEAGNWRRRLPRGSLGYVMLSSTGLHFAYQVQANGRGRGPSVGCGLAGRSHRRRHPAHRHRHG